MHYLLHHEETFVESQDKGLVLQESSFALFGLSNVTQVAAICVARYKVQYLHANETSQLQL